MVYTVEGTKIANLKTTKSIGLSEKFPISLVNQEEGKSSEQSYVCKYSNFYKSIMDRDISKSNFTMSSTWTFNGGLSVVPKDTNARARISTDVATMSYFYNELYIGHFCKLSSLMYGDSPKFEAKKRPSYLGMVVISRTMDTSNKLTAVYGNDTVWEKLGGRFLLTVGSNSANNNKKYGNNTNAGDINFASAKRMGGTKEVLLTTKNIVPHIHTLCENGKALPLGTLPEREKPLEPKLDGGGEYGICSTPGAASSPDWGKGFGDIGALASKVGGIESLHHTKMDAKRKGGRRWGVSSRFGHSEKQNEPGTWASGPISPSEIWGGGVQTHELWGTFQAKFDVGEMTSSCSSNTPLVNIPHNNIPPLIVEYIWERVL